MKQQEQLKLRERHIVQIDIDYESINKERERQGGERRNQPKNLERGKRRTNVKTGDSNAIKGKARE